MDKRKNIIIISIAALSAIVLIATVIVGFLLKRDVGYRVIKVESIDGTVTLERNAKEKAIFKGMNLKSKDRVTTGENTTMMLLADSDKYILAQQNTCFKIKATGNDKAGKLDIDLEYGFALFEIKNKLNEDSEFTVKTPNATTSVRGTTFEVSYNKDKNETIVVVWEGLVEVVTAKQTVMVEAGNMLRVIDDEEPIIEQLAIEEGNSDNGNGEENQATDDIIEVPKYTEGVAFDLIHYVTHNSVGIGVKQLDGWEYVDLSSEYIVDHRFRKANINIGHSATDREDVDNLYDYYEKNNEITLKQTVINADGDEVEFMAVNQGGMITYFYVKNIGNDLYLRIFVREEREGAYLREIDANKFLDITTNNYFVTDNSDNDSSLTEITEQDLPGILKGNLNLSQLQYALGAVQDCKLDGNEDYVIYTLRELFGDQFITKICKPVSTTSEGDIYSLTEINNILSVMTDERINESNILPYNRINGDDLFVAVCDVTYGSWIDVTIDKYYLNTDKEMLVEYSYEKNSGGGQYVKKGKSIAHLLPDKDGKYVIDSIEQVTFEENNY